MPESHLNKYNFFYCLESGGMSDSFSAWGAEIIEKANIANMDSYIEYLYEDTHEKILGSSMILALVKNPYNLKEIAVNGKISIFKYIRTILKILFSVIKEKKSILSK